MDDDDGATALRLALTLASVLVSRDPTIADEMEQVLAGHVASPISDADGRASRSALALVKVARAHARTQHDAFAAERCEDGVEKPTH